MPNILSRDPYEINKFLTDPQFGGQIERFFNHLENPETGQKVDETYALKLQLRVFKQWFPRLVKDSQQRCILGFVQYLSSHLNILRNLSKILATAFKKDYVYSCILSAPYLQKQMSDMYANKVLSENLSNDIVELNLKLYERLSTDNKHKFLESVLPYCDMNLIRLVYKLVNNILTRACHDDCKSNESWSGTELSDSTCSNNTNNQYQFRDIISRLPAPLAMYILCMLDETSLQQARKVNLKWGSLVKQIYKELLGDSSHSVNPTYAKDVDVLVPNICRQTLRVIESGDPSISPISPSQVNFETAFRGVTTHKVIMEEKNVYCGAYNIMVLMNNKHNRRVIDTESGDVMAFSTEDRKICFMDTNTNKMIGPAMKGHAGCIYCLHHCRKKNIVLSGSFDTSVRCWSLENGECQKIYRGHRSTVLCVSLFKNMVVSGSKDGTCRAWDLKSGRCQHVLRHDKAVRAISISEELIISGCEEGELKVWNRTSGMLIKKMKGHRNAILCLISDKWHIVSGGKDGFAMVWSTQGDHRRCLTVLKHPNEVLCIALKFLRVITGSNDGRIRIWNLINGQCCRIIRGSTDGDPINQLFATNNRITINTHTKILVFIFEDIEWNYNLDNDSLQSINQYSSPDIQSNKESRLNWSSNSTVDENISNYGCQNLVSSLYEQEDKSTEDGSSFQTNDHNDVPYINNLKINHLKRFQSKLKKRLCQSAQTIQELQSFFLSQSQLKSCSRLKLKNETGIELASVNTKTKSDLNNVSQTDQNVKNQNIDEENNQELMLMRRLSWAFDKPETATSQEASLVEVKNLLRSQVRSKSKFKFPEFIQLIRDAYQQPQGEIKQEPSVLKAHRPMSCPGKIDQRTLIFLDKSDISQLKDFTSPKEDNNVHKNMIKTSVVPNISTKTIKTNAKFGIQPHKLDMSSESNRFLLKSNLKPGVLRPFTVFTETRKAQSSIIMQKNNYSSGPYYNPFQKIISRRSIVDEKAQSQLRYRLRSRQKLMPVNCRLCDDPLRRHTKFQIKTYQEEFEEAKMMEKQKILIEKQKQKHIQLSFSKGLKFKPTQSVINS
ncbi:CMT1A duplicated region transcript 1 protein-like [Argonauta hians]